MSTIQTPEGWTIENDAIRRTSSFSTFRDAIHFVNNVAQLAESQNHHPDITINYRKVTLTLTTHDAGGLTEKDFTLAVSINELPGSIKQPSTLPNC